MSGKWTIEKLEALTGCNSALVQPLPLFNFLHHSKSIHLFYRTDLFFTPATVTLHSLYSTRVFLFLSLSSFTEPLKRGQLKMRALYVHVKCIYCTVMLVTMYGLIRLACGFLFPVPSGVGAPFNRRLIPEGHVARSTYFNTNERSLCHPSGYFTFTASQSTFTALPNMHPAPLIRPSTSPSIAFHDELISLPVPVVWATLVTQRNLLTGSSRPSGSIGPQRPVRHDQYIIPAVTRPLSLAASSFPASLYFHFIIISPSRSMQANRPTVNHTTIRAASNLLVDSISFTTTSK